jgi:outer membrane protein assembly factor BamB/TolB-like protein
MSETTKAQLSKLTRNDLNIVAKKLKLKGYRRGKKEDLIDRILEEHPSEKIVRFASISFWDRYHNHIYGVASVLGVVLTIFFYFSPFTQSNRLADATHFSKPDNLDLSRSRKRVAILDFSPIESTGSLIWLPPTLSTNITNQLRHFPEVDVYAAETFGSNLSDILAKKPDVKILAGEFSADKQYLDIKARLIEGSTGVEIRSISFHISIDNLNEIRDRLSDLILTALNVKANLVSESGKRTLSPKELLALEYLGRYKLHLKNGALLEANRFLESAKSEGLAPNQYGYYKALLYSKQGRTASAIAVLTKLTEASHATSALLWKHSLDKDSRVLAMEVYKNCLLMLQPTSLSCLSNFDGKVVWDFKGHSFRAFTIAKDKVFVATRAGEVYELSPYDGRSLSTVTVGQSISTLASFAGNLIFTTDGTWMDWQNQYLIGLIDTTAHAISWTRKIQGFTYATPTIIGDHLYLGTIAGFIYALSLNTLKFDWTIDANNQLFYEYFKNRHERLNLFLARTPLTAINGTLYVGGYGSQITSINLLDGTSNKSYPVHLGCWTELLLAEDNVICGSVQNKVSAFSYLNAGLVWQTYIGTDKSLDELADSPLFTKGRAIPTSSFQDYSSEEGSNVASVITSGNIVYSLHKDLIYGINATTGEVLWTYSLSGEETGDLHFASGALYVPIIEKDERTLCKVTVPTEFGGEDIEALSHFKLGELYFADKSLDLAAKEFRSAVALASYLYDSHKFLAEIAEAKKDKESAISNWQSYLKSAGASEPARKHALDSLRRLTHFRAKLISSPHWPGLFKSFNDHIVFFNTPNEFIQADDGKVTLVAHRNRPTSRVPYVFEQGLLLISDDEPGRQALRNKSHVTVEFFDPVNKLQKWAIELVGTRSSTPLLFEDKYLLLAVDSPLMFQYEQGAQNLYAVSRRRSIYALDILTGTQVWTTGFETSSITIPTLLLAGDTLIISSRPSSTDGKTVFVGSAAVGAQKDNISAISARTGVVKWVFQPAWKGAIALTQPKDVLRPQLLNLPPGTNIPLEEEDSRMSSIDMNQLKLEQNSGANEMYALTVLNGELKWKRATEEDAASFPTATDRRVFFKIVSKNSEALISVDSETGEEKWRHQINTLPPFDGQFTYGFGVMWQRRWVFFRKLTIVLEIFPADYPTDGAPLVLNDRVYCSFRNGRVVAFASDGNEPLWNYDIPSTNLSAPSYFQMSLSKLKSGEEKEKDSIAIKTPQDYTYYFAP